MKTSEIKNNLVKEIIDAANKNGFKVTIANLSSVHYVADYGKAFYRIKKGSKTGWEIISELAKALGKLSNDDLLIGKQGNKENPNFFIFGDSIIVCDPIGKSSTDESTLNEDNVPECWKIFIVFRDGDNDYARTYSKNIEVFHSKEEAERKAKEIKAQTPEVKTVSVCKFNGWEGKYEFADKK